MSLPNHLSRIFQYIDQNEDKFLNRLHEAINITSSTSEEENPQNYNIIEWTDKLLKSVGFITNQKNVEDNEPTLLPNVIFGNLDTGNCPNKTTVLIYFHLDTSITQKDEKLALESDVDIHGQDVLNLSSMISWLNTIEAYKSEGIDYPVDIRLIVAPIETELSEGMKNLLNSEKESFVDKVDFVCMNEGSWLQSNNPIFVRRLRGVCYISLEVQCSTRNMESNICSGIIHDAMSDLLYLLEHLTDENGNFFYSESGLETGMLPEHEISFCESADLDLNILKETTGANAFLFDGNTSEIVKHRFILPSLTIHSVENSLDCVNEWSIPASASAKLSVRTYHDNVTEIFGHINIFLENLWSLHKSSNKLKISLDGIHDSWKADVDNAQYIAAIKAAEYVYQKPLGSFNNPYTIPIVNILHQTLGKNILILPIVPENNYINKTIPIKNFLNASKMFASYLYELGEIPKLSSASSSSFISCESIPEICVCGKYEEEIQAASGDSDSPKPKPGLEDESKCVCPYRSQQAQTKDVAVISDDLIESKPPEPPSPEPPSPEPPSPKPCKCEVEFKPVDMEMISVVSATSTASRDPTPIPKPKDPPKKTITPSVDTINCACIPRRFKISGHKEEISIEREKELMKSMISVGSVLSGISGCLRSNESISTSNMKTIGCMCPEKSQATIYEMEMQKERMFCPVLKDESEICNKGGERKHHIYNPPTIDNEPSEFSLWPLSHCSCSGESIAVVPNCDCSTQSPVESTNLEEEID